MQITTDMFIQNPGFRDALGIEQKVVFEGLLTIVADALYPLKDEIALEESTLPVDKHILITVLLLDRESVGVDIAGASERLQLRMRELVDAIDFHATGEEMREKVAALNN